MLFPLSSLKKDTLCKAAHLLILFASSFWALSVATESIGGFLFIGKGGYVLKCDQKNHMALFYVLFSSLYRVPFYFVRLNGN